MNTRDIHSRRRVVLLAAAIASVLALEACGSSSQTLTSPSNTPKCAVTLEGAASTVPASGGTGEIAVRTARECQWSAAADAPWLSIMTGSSGQGEGSIQFRANANPDPVNRTGAITANGQRTDVTQAAGECRFDLGEATASFPPAGGSGSVEIRASSGLCSWTAQSHDEWIVLRTGGGRGTASLGFDVASTSGPPRTGSITAAGQQFSVIQSEGCTFSIAPTGHAAASSGSTGTIAVTAGAGCPWTAASNVEWVRITQGASGSGPGTVTFSVSATNSTSRAGTLLVAGQTFSITQGEGCTYTISPSSQSVPAAGGTGSVGVSAGPGCAWTASSNAPWLTITSGGTGAGNGTVAFRAAATSGPARAGTLAIAGQTFTVNQGQGCTFTISPESASMPASGGNGTVSVTAPAGCGWSAASNAPWISINGSASGSGNGSIAFTAAATNGPARSGTLTVAGRTFTVNQGQGCTFAISPESASHGSAAAAGEFRLTAPAGCGWNAAADANATWISLTSPASGSGDATIRYAVAGNPGAPRTGNISVGGRTFRIDQSSGCALTVNPTSQDVGSGGGTLTVSVAADGSCAWNAASNAPWISVASPPNGSGNGSVQLAVAPNAEGARTGTVTIAGQTVTINQAGGCAFSLTPPEQTVPASGASGSFAIATAATCAWTAAPSAAWIALTSAASGVGPGTVQFVAQGNQSGPRVGAIAVGGQSFTIRQESGCSLAVAPESIPMPAAGGTTAIAVNGGGDCSWTAASSAPWIAVTAGASGTGPGTVQIQVQPNTSNPRTGTLTVAGRTVSVTQENGCTYTLDREFIQVGRADGRRTVAVATDAACGWTAVSQVNWIQVVSGASGTGPGEVEFRFEDNATNEVRRGTLIIGGRTVTVEQSGGGGDGL